MVDHGDLNQMFYRQLPRLRIFLPSSETTNRYRIRCITYASGPYKMVFTQGLKPWAFTVSL